MAHLWYLETPCSLWIRSITEQDYSVAVLKCTYQGMEKVRLKTETHCKKGIVKIGSNENDLPLLRP